MNTVEKETLFNNEMEDWRKKSVVSIIKDRFFGAVNFQLFWDFYSLIKELQKPYENKEIERLVEYYHWYYTKRFWDVFAAFSLILLFTSFWALLLAYDDKDTQIYCSLLQVPALFSFFFVLDILVHKRKNFIKRVLIVYLIAAGVALWLQNASLEKFKIDEIWLLIDSLFFTIGIVMWLDPFRVITSFLLLQLFYFMLMHYSFGVLTVHFYVGFSVFVLYFWMTIWVMSYVMRSLIKFIHENEELASTIQQILKIFPEGVLIRSAEKSSFANQLKFANDAAVTTLGIDSESDSKANISVLDFKLVESWWIDNELTRQEPHQQDMNLPAIFEYHENMIIKSQKSLCKKASNTSLEKDWESASIKSNIKLVTKSFKGEITKYYQLHSTKVTIN